MHAVASTTHVSRTSSADLGRNASKFDQLTKFVRELPDLSDVDMDPLLHDLCHSLDPYARPPKSAPANSNHAGTFHTPPPAATKLDPSFPSAKFPSGPLGKKNGPRLVHPSKEPEGPGPIFRLRGSKPASENLTGKSAFPSEPADSDSAQALPLGARRTVDTQACKPVVAFRIKWKYAPGFDPEPFLKNPLTLEAFRNPNILRLPCELWPKMRKAQVHSSKDELLMLGSKWDALGALTIFREDEIEDLHECVGLFCIPKDADFDRLILNPVVVNSRMSSLNDYTKLLGHGAQLCSLHIPSGHVARYSADDLAEFYYTVTVGRERAKRNIIGLPFAAHELRHMQSFNPSRHFGTCYLALACLAMGDSLAVELAQASHMEVLRTVAGCMLRSETVAFRRPFPRGDFCEFLCIDDHIAVQCLSRAAARASQPLRDTAVFRQAEAAYQQVNLVPHPVKKQRHQTRGTLLGAYFDGELGMVSAPLDRTLVLMLCTCEIARRGACTPQLLQTLLGSWIHVLMFRRPALCVLNAVFADAARMPATQIMRLSRNSRNELLCVSVLGPLLQTDLRASWCPKVFMMDASPSGAGLCEADATPSVVQELWRFSEQHGYHTRLEGPASAILREKGFESAVEYGEAPAQLMQDPFPLHPSLVEGVLWDCCELSAGITNWSTVHANFGLRVLGLGDSSPGGLTLTQLLEDSVWHRVRSLILRGVVREWHVSFPGLSFACLRKPRKRSALQPAGFTPQAAPVQEQNVLARRVCMLLQLVASRGLFFSLCHTAGSVLWRLACFQRLLDSSATKARVLAACCFGSPCRHPTSWIHNKPWLLGFGGSCRCSRTRARIVVQGTFSAATGQAFDAACRPSAVGVYGRTPLVGESVSAFVATPPVPLLRRMAAGSLEASHGSVDDFPLSRVAGAFVALSELCDPTEVVCAEPRLSHDDPEWIGEIADSLPFREVLRYKFLRPGHINVLEARMYKTFQKYCARHHPSSRTLGLLDSRVTLGAVAKGRSSSPALSRVLQGTLPYTLGSGLYSGGLHVYSSKNRADGPSRNRALEPPTKEVPVWYSDLCAGKHWRFDVACAASRCSKLCARWLRLLLLLGGDRTESRALALGASGSAGPPRLEVRLYSDHRGSYAQMLGCLYDLGAR